MSQSLPPGWEVCYTDGPEGQTAYYVDHNTQTSHWELPQEFRNSGQASAQVYNRDMLAGKLQQLEDARYHGFLSEAEFAEARITAIRETTGGGGMRIAPEPQEVRRQAIVEYDLPVGRPTGIDVHEIEGCWGNIFCCWQGFRPTKNDEFVTTCSVVFCCICCGDNGEVYTRIPGSSKFYCESKEVGFEFWNGCCAMEKDGCGLHCKCPFCDRVPEVMTDYGTPGYSVWYGARVR